ncbi:hypothetical protein TMatcc_001244 [Talaromyces marneffei ATCC 18224]|nr:uncharacterized protein EYB26_003742 [Talaromyces marneffei]KAE8550140.1 hypothetical protein EYB25_008671 [Talaromyces marneffei]QGA16075.1 hypothetical protein EYB26_003742 [Talaromyces marneffei]
MWARIKGLRRTTDLQKLLNEKAAAVAVAQFVHDTGMLAQFRDTDPQAMGTYEEEQAPADAELTERNTGLGERANAQADDASTRSACSPIFTNNETDKNFGSTRLNGPTREALQDENGDLNVRVDRESHVESRRMRAVDLWN